MDKRRWEELQRHPRRAEALGVDVAAGGRDDTCWTLVDRQGVIAQIVQDTPNTMEIPGRTLRLLEEHQLSARRAAIDAGGGGKQIADRLREQGYWVQIVGFGESAEAKQAYRNRRAEMYGKLREYLNPKREAGVFALPPDAVELRRELAVLPLQYDSEGRMQMIPKEASSEQGRSLRRLLGRSPDRADSLALAVWALSRPRPPSYDGPAAYVPEPGDERPLIPEELQKLPEPLRDWIEPYQDPRYWNVGDDWDEDWPGFARRPRSRWW